MRHGYVRTTFGRAKELQRLAERLITLSKKDSLAARRAARRVLVGHSSANRPAKLLTAKSGMEATAILRQTSMMAGEDLVKYLFDEVGPRYQMRNGGYTRLTRTGLRRGDGAQTAVLELV
ncbi:MAG: 50S ribosomal protein L17 [Fimbriimonas ginsengisoli]|nr:50S ribosomal protein L17 [Fimbriimonas ginsengisoli]